MSYITKRSGFTGPEGKIGRGTAYHQDLKLLESLPIAERVKMIDAIAQQNQAIGREIEFSNPAVGGMRWSLGADLSDKVDLLNRAASAHGHSTHPGWQSFDYYTSFKGKSRFDKGAVEDASIYIPAVAGGKVRRGSGGGYGYYSEALDPSGRVIARVGHGNIDRPEATALIDVGELSAGPLDQPQQTAGKQKGASDFLRDYLDEQMTYQLMGQMLQKPRATSSLDQFKEMMGSMPLGIMRSPLA